MDTPIDIKRINPDIQDPVSKSVIYSFSTKDGLIDKDGDILYKFPYSKDTFWTNFRYSCYGVNGSFNKQLHIGIILVTSDGYTYTIADKEERVQEKWLDTVWPIPSVKAKNDGAIYFKVKPIGIKDLICEVSIKLLGFMDLFPAVNHYFLLSSFDTYQYEFSKFEEDENHSCGSIYNVENYDYIRDLINKSCGIRLLSRY